MKRAIPIFVALFLAACTKEVVQQKAHTVKEKVKNAVEDISTPLGKPDDAAARERERFDQQWRQLQSFRAQQAAIRKQQEQAAAAAKPPATFRFVTGVKGKFKGLDAQGINDAPISVPITGDVRGPSVLRAQVYLDRIHFSVGSIDGRWGRNSAITVWWYQRARGFDATGDVDEQTFRRIAAEAQYAPVVVK